MIRSKYFVLFLVLTTFPIYSFAAGEWEHVKKTDDGINVDKKEIPGNPVLAFRGDGLIDAPLTKVATIIFEVKRAPEWVQDLELAKIVRWVSEFQWIEYDHIRTPPIIMKDRDFVSKVTLSIDHDTKAITFLYANTVDSEVPETSYVRGDLINTAFILTPVENGAKTHIMGEIHCDPKGSIAKWIVNYFQSDWPIDTVRNLRKQAAKTDVADNEKIISLYNSASATPTPEPTATPSEKKRTKKN